MRYSFRLVSIFLIAATFSFAQGQRRTPGTANTGPAPATVEFAENSDPVSNYPEKGLPPIAILGEMPSPALAAKLAREISIYDDESLPLLMAAVQKAGFFILDRDQRVLYRPISGDGMGMAFYDYELVGMLKGSAAGLSTTAAKFAETAASGDPSMFGNGRPDLMLLDLKGAMSSDDAQLSYLAHFIVELGKNLPSPIDITTTPPESAKINIIQASLLERLLLRDFIFLYQDNFPDTDAVFRKPLIKTPAAGFRFVNAAWTIPDDDPCAFMSDIASLQKLEKTGKKTAETVKIFKELMNSIDNTPGNVPKPKTPSILTKSQGFFKEFSKGIGKANAALNWLKLILALSNVKADITVQDPMPLKRTKSHQKTGEERVVKAKFTMDIANTELLNCAGRSLSIATGVNFSVPKGGPMKDKPVAWEVVMSGNRYEKYENTPVWVDAPNRSDASRQFTNSDGISEIKLTGKPQRKNLESEPVVPLARKVDLNISIATEKMDAAKDIPKVATLGLGVEIDPVSIIGFIPEMLGKMKLNSYKIFVPVMDWQPCSEDWGGTISYKRVLSNTIVVKSSPLSNGNTTGGGIRTISQIDKADITLNPRLPEEVDIRNPKPATIVVTGTHKDITEALRESDPCCGILSGKFTTTYRLGHTIRYSGEVARDASVQFRGTQRDYGLSLNFNSDGFTAHKKEFMEILETSCPLENDSAYSRSFEFPFMLGGVLTEGRYGERFANEAGEILQGTKKVKMPDGSEITWGWALARCKS